MKQTIEGLQVDNKTVFVRVDFNVPMKDGVFGTMCKTFI